jgi:hypothetical protein
VETGSTGREPGYLMVEGSANEGIFSVPGVFLSDATLTYRCYGILSVRLRKELLMAKNCDINFANEIKRALRLLFGITARIMFTRHSML